MKGFPFMNMHYITYLSSGYMNCFCYKRMLTMKHILHVAVDIKAMIFVLR